MTHRLQLRVRAGRYRAEVKNRYGVQHILEQSSWEDLALLFGQVSTEEKMDFGDKDAAEVWFDARLKFEGVKPIFHHAV